MRNVAFLALLGALSLFCGIAGAGDRDSRTCVWKTLTNQRLVQRFQDLPDIQVAMSDGFRPFGDEDRVLVKGLTDFIPHELSIYHPDNLSAWRGNYELMAAQMDGALLLLARGHKPGDRNIFLEPIGVSPAQRAEIIRKFLKQYPTWQGKPNVFAHVSQPVRDHLATDTNLHSGEVEGKSEYVYEARALATLHTLKKQRKEAGEIYRTLRTHGAGFRYLSLREVPAGERTAMMAKLKRYLEDWALSQDEAERSRHDFQQQLSGTRRMLDHFYSSDLSGGVLLVDDHVVGFTLGGKLNPHTFTVYVESAQRDIGGNRGAVGKALNQRLVLTALLESLAGSPADADREAMFCVNQWLDIAFLGGLAPEELTATVQKIVSQDESNRPSSSPRHQSDAEAVSKAEAAAALRLRELSSALKRRVSHEQLEAALKRLVEARRERAYLLLARVSGPNAIIHINHQEDGGEPRDKYAKELYKPIRGLGKNYFVQSGTVPPVTWDTYRDEN